MYGARALAMNYDALVARHEDFHRQAAEHRRAVRSAKPGADDRVREAHPVPKHRRLLGVAR
jgi:hypothetical protein